ncbi:MAG: Gfo/Idh/MocA family oxidoreductase, partial [Ktedonobacterales bacterium]
REPRELWGRLVTEVGGLPVDGVVETLPGSYESYYALVRDALRTGAPPPVDPAEALLALRVIETARESARQGSALPFSARADAH